MPRKKRRRIELGLGFDRLTLVPVRVRGVNIFPIPDDWGRGWVDACADQLRRGEVLYTDLLLIRRARRGHWAYQSADGAWSEVKELDAIPWDQDSRVPHTDFL